MIVFSCEWNPSIGASETWTSARAVVIVSARRFVNVDLPEPGAPAMPST